MTALNPSSRKVNKGNLNQIERSLNANWNKAAKKLSKNLFFFKMTILYTINLYNNKLPTCS